MVIDVAQQQAVVRPVHDQPDAVVDPNRPEVRVLRAIELVEPHPVPRRVHLQVKDRRLDGLLLIARHAGETVGECVGDAEVHQMTT